MISFEKFLYYTLNSTDNSNERMNVRCTYSFQKVLFKFFFKNIFSLLYNKNFLYNYNNEFNVSVMEQERNEWEERETVENEYVYKNNFYFRVTELPNNDGMKR